VNTAPVLAAIANQTINSGSTLALTFAANDPDLPANTLNFGLISAPPGAAVNAVTGVFTWTPTVAQASSTNTIFARVTDNGVPSLSDQKTFTIVVTPWTQTPQDLALRITTYGNNLILSANVSLEGYDLQVKDNLSSTTEWTTLSNVPVGNNFVVPFDPDKKTRFYRLQQRSRASISLHITTSANNLVMSANGPMEGYDLQAKANLSSYADWMTLSNTPVGNQFILPLDPSKRTQFYRVQPRSASSLRLFGVPTSR
jgi:hypothetical protein